MGKTTMYDQMKRLFDFPFKEARFMQGDVTFCLTAGAHGGVGFELWRKGNEYGLCDAYCKPDRDAVYTAAKPNASDHGMADCSRELSGDLPLPQIGLCFGYKEGGAVTGFMYLHSNRIGLGEGFRWMVAPGSGLMKALPQLSPRHLLPDLNRFWDLFKQGKLVEMTERVAKGAFVGTKEGLACRIDGKYYAATGSRPEVLVDPRAFFEKNGRYPLSVAEAIGRNVLSIRARA